MSSVLEILLRKLLEILIIMLMKHLKRVGIKKLILKALSLSYRLIGFRGGQVKVYGRQEEVRAVKFA